MADYNTYRNITSQIGALEVAGDKVFKSKMSLEQATAKYNQILDKINTLKGKIKKEWFANNLSDTPVGNCSPDIFNKDK